MNRRFFLKSGSIALASVGASVAAPGFLQRAIMANERNAITGGKRKILIAIFQRGAVDGLNMVVPFGESSYYDARPTIARTTTTATAKTLRRSPNCPMVRAEVGR